LLSLLNNAPNPIADELHHIGEPPNPRKPPGCVVVFALILMLTLAAAAAYPFYLRWQYLTGRSPEELRRLELFNTRPVSIPEWQNPNPISPELRTAVQKYLDAHEPHLRFGSDLLREPEITSAVAQLQRGNSIPDDRWTSLTAVVEETSGVTAAAAEMAALPDYSVSALMHLAEFNHFLDVGKALNVASLIHFRNGETTVALATALLPFQLCTSIGEPLSLGGNLHVISTLDDPAALIRVLASTSDTALLQHCLQEVSRAALNFRSLPEEARATASFMAMLHRYAREGYPVDITPGKPGRFYAVQLYKQEKAFLQWKLDKMPFTDPRRPKLQREAEQATPAPNRDYPAFYANYLESVNGADINFLVFDEFQRDNEKLMRKPAAEYQLLRLHLAQRILQSRGEEQTTASLLALLPDLTSIPADPFSPTGEALRFDQHRNHFYSIGEDGVDNHQPTITATTPLRANWLGDDIVAVH